MRETSLIEAVVSAKQLITQMYGRPDLGALVSGEVGGIASLRIEWHEPETMRIELINTYDATVSNGPTSVRGSGRDSFTGTLALQSDGTWRGTVTGKADGSLTRRQPGKPVCRSSWLATQQIEVVGQDAPNSATGDFVFIFYPLADPTGPTGSGSKCPPTKRKHNGVAYAPYNDYNVSQAAEEQGVAIILPPKPGARLYYPFSSADATSNWQVNIEFPPTP